jgi:hypothetical protein
VTLPSLPKVAVSVPCPLPHIHGSPTTPPPE